jgi:predicted ATPase
MPKPRSNKILEQDTSPFLRTITVLGNHAQRDKFPFTIPALRDGLTLQLSRNVTFFVGENGSGKSTLLEAVAAQCGFNVTGGGRNHNYSMHVRESGLSSFLRLSWRKKVTEGFFMRAESFFNFATYIDDLENESPGLLNAYGGKSLHAQSHGEAFLSLFANRFGQGIYILDEPEAALSPQRQLSFLAILHDLQREGRAQFLIATHSPLLFSYPNATVFSLDGNEVSEVNYKDTDHYLLMKRFLDAPERYFTHLFSDE